MVQILTFIIKLYQAVSRAIFPRACRFHPTCSQYAVEALEKYGVVAGSSKALIRILKCSPLSRGGYDPLK